MIGGGEGQHRAGGQVPEVLLEGEFDDVLVHRVVEPVGEQLAHAEQALQVVPPGAPLRGRLARAVGGVHRRARTDELPQSPSGRGGHSVDRKSVVRERV